MNIFIILRAAPFLSFSMKPLFINVLATMGIAAVTAAIILIIAASAPPEEVATGSVISNIPQGTPIQAKTKAGPVDSLVSAFRKRLLSTANEEAARISATPENSTKDNSGTPKPAKVKKPRSKPENSFREYSPSVATSHIASAANRSGGRGSRGKSGSDSTSTNKIRSFMGSSGGGGGGGGSGGLSYEEKLAKSLGESLTPEEIDELIANQEGRDQKK